MADVKTGLEWSEAQWERINSAVTEAFGKASVAGAFLPCYGPLPEGAEYVRDEKFTETGAMVRVADDTTLKLFNLTVKVELSSEQVAEDALSSALLAFRRAANTLAQVEDDLVFNGFDGNAAARDAKEDLEKLKKESADAKNERDVAVQKLRLAKGAALDEAKRNVDQKTAVDEAAKKVPEAEAKAKEAETKAEEAEAKEKATRNAKIAVSHPDTLNGLAKVDHASKTQVANLRTAKADLGEHLVTAVVNAIAALEDDSHSGPFACVLGSNLFEEAHRPREKSMVLPADTITPLLNGPLLRSGQMDKDTGIVVSLAASDIDIVVATPPKAQFLQLTPEAKYLFRVYEKFVLRVKDSTAVKPLDLS
jgi:uncharacterized linocin/CFP29 family protein